MSEEPRRKWDRWLAEFRQRALERMKTCQNVKVLAKELGVARQQLYMWRQQAEGRKKASDPAQFQPCGHMLSSTPTQHPRLKRVNHEGTERACAPWLIARGRSLDVPRLDTILVEPGIANPSDWEACARGGLVPWVTISRFSSFLPYNTELSSRSCLSVAPCSEIPAKTPRERDQESKGLKRSNASGKQPRKCCQSPRALSRTHSKNLQRKSVQRLNRFWSPNGDKVWSIRPGRRFCPGGGIHEAKSR